jgi:hypothetical protein
MAPHLYHNAPDWVDRRNPEDCSTKFSCLTYAGAVFFASHGSVISKKAQRPKSPWLLILRRRDGHEVLADTAALDDLIGDAFVAEPEVARGL